MTGRAARSLEKSRSLLAAKLHVAMAFRILEAKKSKDYDAAVQNLETARRLLIRQGREDEWEALVGEIRAGHRRKTGFMARFEPLAEGRSARGPSFLERARKRWDAGASREGGGS